MVSGLHLITAASVWGDWSFNAITVIDLIAATTNAFNAALLVQRPDHWKQYTFVGIMLLALTGGITGSVSRDVILGEVQPAALLNPWYIILCVIAAQAALMIR